MNDLIFSEFFENSYDISKKVEYHTPKKLS